MLVAASTALVPATSAARPSSRTPSVTTPPNKQTEDSGCESYHVELVHIRWQFGVEKLRLSCLNPVESCTGIWSSLILTGFVCAGSLLMTIRLAMSEVPPESSTGTIPTVMKSCDI